MDGRSISQLVSLCARHHRAIEFDADGGKRTLAGANACLDRMTGAAPSVRVPTTRRPGLSRREQKLRAKRNKLERAKARARLLTTGPPPDLVRLWAWAESVACCPGWVTLADEHIAAGENRDHGLTFEQAKELGIGQLVKGWRKRLLGLVVSTETYGRFLALRDWPVTEPVSSFPIAGKKARRRAKRKRWLEKKNGPAPAGTVSFSVVGSDGSPLYSGTLGVGGVVLRWDAAETA